MMTSLLLAVALAQRPPPRPPPPPPPPVYVYLNALANPGFESSPLLPAWTTAGSYLDPVGDGDPDDFDGFSGARTTSMAHSGTASFSFGLNYTQGEAFVHSVVSQTLANPPTTSQVTDASLYAWSAAGSFEPDSLNIEIDYANGVLPTSMQVPVSGGQWRYVSFKSALRPGATVTRIALSSDSYPYSHTPIWVDDVSLVARYQLHPL